MTTPTIYTVGQLRAYLQGKAEAVTANPYHNIHDQGRRDAYAEVIAMIEAIEAYDASKAAVSHGSVWDAAHEATAGAQAIDDESGYAVGSVDSLRP